jgi:hypothetical protein
MEALRAQKWEFTDKETGELKSGVKLWLFGEVEHTKKSTGRECIEAAAPAEVFEVLSGKLPAMIIVDGDLTQRKIRGSNGRDTVVAGLKIKSVKLQK